MAKKPVKKTAKTLGDDKPQKTVDPKAGRTGGYTSALPKSGKSQRC
jgi:hypothetical protein